MLAPPMTDSDEAHGANEFTVESCEHAQRPPKRVCDVCKSGTHAFTACSNACLQTHLQAAHPTASLEAPVRARHAQTARNLRSARDWELFTPHRERVMAVIPTGPPGGSLCVLGAGKCDDLDLPGLAERFSVIHLVDLDDEALARARDRQPARVRDAIVPHGGVDLSGLLPRLDEWAEAFPDDRTLHQVVFSAAHAVVDGLGGPFDVTVSTCVLSQLLLPFQDTWAASEETWNKLVAATTAVHVGVLTHATAPRGAACLVFDVLSSDRAPGLTTLRDYPPERLQAAVEAGAQSGAIALHPDPGALLAQISHSGVAAPEPGPRLTGPWIWNTGAALQLVYALSFRRP
jgi:hypothetical protein